MTRTTRRLATLPIVGIALTLIAFGVVRGSSATGPARGVRMLVAIEPPVDAASLAMAEHVVSERIDEKGNEVRVLAAGDQLVVEYGEDDPDIVHQVVEVLERRATLRLHTVDAAHPWLANATRLAVGDSQYGVRVDGGTLVADDRWEDLSAELATAIGCTGRVDDGKRHCMHRGDQLLAKHFAELAAREPALVVPAGRMVAFARDDGHTWRAYLLERDAVLDGKHIQHAEITERGVVVDVSDGRELTRIKAGTPIAFVLDGTIKMVGTPDRVTTTGLHVPTTGATEDDAIAAAISLISVIEAGAVHPLHVRDQKAFERATGFLPRAWPFLAVGAALLLGAALLWGRRRA